MSLFPEHKYSCVSEHSAEEVCWLLRPPPIIVTKYLKGCKSERAERCCPSWRGRHAAMQQKPLITTKTALNAGAPFVFPSASFHLAWDLSSWRASTSHLQGGSLVHPLEIPPRQAQKWVSWVIPNPVKLMRVAITGLQGLI